MSPDNKPVPDLAMSDEDPSEMFEPLYAESDSPAKPSRMPRWKMMASAGVVLALSIAYSGHIKQILPFAKNWQIPAFTWLSAGTVPPSAQKTSTDNPITALPTASPLDLRPDRFIGVQQAMPLQPPIDNPKITQMEKQLASLTTRIETQQQTYTVQFKTLENQLTALQQQASKQQVARTAIKPLRRKSPAVWHKMKTHQPAKIKTAIRKRPVHSTVINASVPDFTLASIDHWGDKTQAVLRYHGQLYTLVPGSTLSGWTVVEFADSREGVYMANHRGQRRLLALE
ncbi:hypothetical protein CRENPOLYSF2_190006 [Crenothrix polyspora]|uniref:Uncharacterized protein n=1 Tax=Crenothrix polyspora TaxID=360316 RepID=A0A1R4H3N1_9GAMM|nr:hypothetical protein [Crenothrix polyspora]SJM90863.1 hypothetical protein CRENPOLYSF2_190006 [Crenothrix polyspora]